MENLTNEMIELLKNISDLCYQAGEVIYSCRKTEGILDTCCELCDMIDSLLVDK